MRENEVVVISQSQSFPVEGPGDGTTAVSTHTALDSVATAVANGAVWVNSAGNQAGQNSFFARYRDDDDEWMDFAATEKDNVPIDNNRVHIGTGYESFVLRWKNREGATNAELDLLICEEANCPVDSVLNAYERDTNTRTFKGTGLVFEEEARRVHADMSQNAR